MENELPRPHHANQISFSKTAKVPLSSKSKFLTLQRKEKEILLCSKIKQKTKKISNKPNNQNINNIR